METPEQLYKIARFALRPGGTLIVSCPDNCLGPEVEPEHVRVIDMPQMLEYLSIFKDQSIGKIRHFLIGFGIR